MIILGGSSRQSLATLRIELDSTLKGVSADQASAIANDLFAALVGIDSSTGLRRALTDSARDSASKAELVSDLFKSSLGAPALALLGRHPHFDGLHHQESVMQLSRLQSRLKHQLQTLVTR